MKNSNKNTQLPRVDIVNGAKKNKVVHADNRTWITKDKQTVLMSEMSQEERDHAFSYLSKLVCKQMVKVNRMNQQLKDLDSVSKEKGHRITLIGKYVDEALPQRS